LLLWGYVVQVRLLLSPTTMMDHLTSAVRCYSPHNSDIPSDIRVSLLLWGHVAWGQLLLAPTAVTDHLSGPLLLAPTVATNILTIDAHWYYGDTWHKRGY
jgi:hypothetical protein